jgi:hypothetical protein
MMEFCSDIIPKQTGINTATFRERENLIILFILFSTMYFFGRNYVLPISRQSILESCFYSNK